MSIHFLIDVFKENKERDAIVWKGKVYSYQWLLDCLQHWQDELRSKNIKPGTVVMLEADFSPNAIVLFLALVEHRCILVPSTPSTRVAKDHIVQTAQVETIVCIDPKDNVVITQKRVSAQHALYEKIRQLNHAGLVLFSSGSTGEPKAAVHDLTNVLEKFKTKRHCYRAISFLLYDHIGGLNTMLYMLSNGGCLVTVSERSPDGILKAVEQYKVELLPVSPTFLNLILISEAYKKYNLDCLKVISYGTEPMAESTLQRFHQLFPQVTLQQTYGLSELGILRSKSKSSDSLWVKLGGEGFEVRIVEHMLHIKAETAMLGYLNAPSPFTKDGWMNTGDRVEVEGEYVKILGRESDIINVGGQKVYPAEVENVIQQMDNVAEVMVFGEKNLIVGNLVCAKIRLLKQEDHKAFTLRLKKYCGASLEAYKIPVKVVLIDEALHNERFKKRRNEKI